jgi:tripartite-type tricarboxylate transporter receptor subunit TctC
MKGGLGLRMRRRAALSLAIAALGGRVARSQPAGGPFRPARMIVPFPAGTSLDLAARTVAEGLARRRGHPIAVENRAGADGVLGAEAFARARPGEALLYSINAVVTVAPLLADRLPYDPDADLVPVHPGATDFIGLTVPEALPVRSVADLVEQARARPGALNWYAPGAGYLAFRNFMRAAGGLDMAYVAYRGSPPALLDLAAGRIHAALTPLGAAMPLLREGRLRLLAVANPSRSPVVPEAPTAAEAGFPALEMEGAHGLFGWRGMPEEARAELARQAAEALAEPAAAGRLRAAGMEPRAATTPAAFAAELAKTRAHWAALARDSGAKPPD